MKEVREERFKKKEDIGFNPIPLPETPTAPESRAGESVPASEPRESLLPEHRTEPPTPALRSAPGYVVTVPRERRKTRQSFDIFEDQYDALKKLQLAEAEHNKAKAAASLAR